MARLSLGDDMGRRRQKLQDTDDINLWAPIMGLVLLAAALARMAGWDDPGLG